MGYLSAIEAHSTSVAANTTTTVTAASSFTVAVGDTLTVFCSSGQPAINATSAANGASTGAATVTWTEPINIAPASASPIQCFLGAVTVAGTLTPRVVFTSTYTQNNHGGFVASRFNGVTMPATPNVAYSSAKITTAPFTGSITTKTANSVLSVFNADWNGVKATPTYAGGATAAGSYQNATAGTLCYYGTYQSAATVGAQTYGITSFSASGEAMTIAAIELPPPVVVTARPGLFLPFF